MINKLGGARHVIQTDPSKGWHSNLDIPIYVYFFGMQFRRTDFIIFFSKRKKK
jgi:hypothetical protein